VCYAKGWHELRKEDTGLLWEHIVLNELHAHLQTHAIHYWRDKQGHEIDFVLRNKSTHKLTVIECKFSTLQANSSQSMITNIGKNIEAFRQYYPHGENFIVASDVEIPFERSYEDITLSFINTKDLIKKLSQI